MTISQFMFGAYLLITLVIIIFSIANKNTPLWREIMMAVTWPLVFLTVIILLVYLPFYARSMRKKIYGTNQADIQKSD